MGTKPAIRRISIALDIEQYGKLTAPEQADAQDRLLWIAVNFLRAAGVKLSRCMRQDEGDGQLIMLPSGIDEAHVLPAAIMALECALRRVNAVPGLAGRLRMRASMAQGPVQQGAAGFVGAGVMAACRLIDAEAVRAALRDHPDASLVAIVSDDLYQQVFSQGYGAPYPTDFRNVQAVVDSKGYSAPAWLYVPSAGLATTLVPPFTVPDVGERSLLAVAIPIAVLGARSWTGSYDLLHESPADPHQIPSGHQDGPPVEPSLTDVSSSTEIVLVDAHYETAHYATSHDDYYPQQDSGEYGTGHYGTEQFDTGYEPS